jgi:hypothetical protein
MKPTVGTAKPINTAAATDTAREWITAHLSNEAAGRTAYPKPEGVANPAPPP